MFRLLRKLKIGEWLLLVLCIALIVGQIYFEMALPEWIGALIVHVQTPAFTPEMLWPAALRLLLCALASFALMLTCSILMTQIASGFGRTLRSELFSKVVSLGKEEIDRYSVPDLVTRTTGDVQHVQLFFAFGFQIAVKAPILSLWATMKIVRVSWELTAVTAGFLFCILLLIFVSFRLLLPRFRKMRKALQEIETIADTPYSGEDADRTEAFHRADESFSQAQFSCRRISSAMLPTATLGMSGLTLSLFWLGAFLIERIPGREGRLSMFGDIVVFGNYACMVTLSLLMLAAVFSLIPAARISAGRINKVLSMDSSVQSGTRVRGSQRGTLEFKDVSFRYPDSDRDALSHVSFRIARGESAAIVGGPDCGKTTIAQLAARIYDVTEGQILLDGIDIREYSLDKLYDKLSYVMQTPTLFGETVEDAVNFGESDAVKSEEHTWQALALADANDFVERLPDGLHEHLEPSDIPAGQRRRLSLARALARRPEILILDDPLIDLDPAANSILHANLEEELRGITTILLTRKIDGLTHPDLMLWMEDGRIVRQIANGTCRSFRPSPNAFTEEGDAHA